MIPLDGFLMTFDLYTIHQRLLLLDAFCREKIGSCQMYIHQNTHLVQAEEKFKELAEAYSILKQHWETQALRLGRLDLKTGNESHI